MQMNIENIWYKKGDRFDTLFIHGYGFDDNGDPLDLNVLDGDKSIDFECHQINRLDVQTILARQKVSLNTGFNIIIKNPRIKQDLKIGANHQILQTYTYDQLQSMVDSNPIVLNVEHIGDMPGNNSLTLIYGWAFSLTKEKLTFKVVDQQGVEIKSTYRKLMREDLYDNGFVDYENRFQGFQVLIESKDAKAFTLVVSDGLHEATKQSRKEETPKGNLLSSYIRALSPKKLQKAYHYLLNHGISGFLERLKQGPGAPLDYYHQWFLSKRIKEEELNLQRQVEFSYSPKISILVPTFNTPKEFLDEMVQSVIHQSYSNWELCIADGSQNNDVLAYIESCKDARIKVKKLDQNYGISGNTNEALSLATGDYVGLYDHDDVLELDALFEVVKSLQEKKYDIVYTDEDKLDNENKIYVDPNFKPDFSEDLLLSHNYITHFFVVKREILEEIGGFRKEYDGAQDYDLILRSTLLAKAIHHIPKVLYHWRMHSLSTAENPESKMYCYDAGKKAIESYLRLKGIDGSVEMLPKPWYGLYHTKLTVKNSPLVSIVIPNKDEKETLKACIQSLVNVNTYKNIEIIIVENNSTSSEIFDYYKELESKYSNMKILYYEGDFNYSRINNFGVKGTKGDYILFLNNDTEVIEPTAIEQMLGYCQKEEVGIVGAKLLYADNTIQHAGVVVGFGGYAGHVFHGLAANDLGFMMRPLLNCNYSAVTAACLMSKKSCFEKVNGFDETFKVAGNDIDYCLKVREQGYTVVYNAFALWHHYESKTRGYEDTLEKVARFDGEIARFQEKWGYVIEKGDPYYNPNFYIQKAPFSLY